MKIIEILSWILLALEALCIVLLIANPNAGDDAAGRGVARGYGIVLLPVLLVFAGLLYWSHRSPSRTLRWSAFLLVALPFFIGACLFASDAMQEWSYSVRAARAGHFPDKHLTQIAEAIKRRDYAAAGTLLEKGRIDWEVRDGLDATLLGFAVKLVRDDYQNNPPVEAVKILLAHGAPLADSATRPDEHLMETVFDGNSPGSLQMLQAILDHGGDPNAKDGSGLPLIHTTSCNVEKLKVLSAHGADLSIPGNRTDRPKWTPLMNAVYMRQWDQALYLLGKGVSISYQAPDGNTAASILADRVKEYSSSIESEPGYSRVAAALKEK